MLPLQQAWEIFDLSALAPSRRALHECLKLVVRRWRVMHDLEELAGLLLIEREDHLIEWVFRRPCFS